MSKEIVVEAPGTEVAPREVAVPSGPVNMGQIVAMAEKGVDPASIRELVALYKDVHAIQAEQAFNVAMHAVQSIMQTIKIPLRGKNVVSKNGTTVPYPLLSDIQKALAAPLAEHGLSYSFDTEAKGNGFTVILRVSHVMGVTRETRTTLPLDSSGSKNPTQGVGSTESYGMRYGLVKAFGLVRYLMDDDAASAGDTVEDTVSDEQLANLEAVWAEVSVDKKAFFAYHGVKSLKDLPASKYTEAIEQLERRRK